MALSTPKEEFLADKSISELRNHSKYDWLFSVFQLYVESCDWKSLHFIYSESETIRQDQILDEKYKGLKTNGKSLANFRAWNRLAGIQTDDFQVGAPELQNLDNAVLGPEAAKRFNQYMELLPRALESYSYSEAKLPMPADVWITNITCALEEALSQANCQETLSDILELPLWDWPLDCPLDLWPHGQFSLNCYYYASLFSSWLQSEPSFFSKLKTPDHLGTNKAIRTAEMESSTTQKWDRRSCTAIAFYSLIDPEDWIMAFAEVIPGLNPTYGLKLGSLEKRITYWNYNKEDKRSFVTRLLNGMNKTESLTQIDDYTLQRLQRYFWEEAVEKLQQITKASELTEALITTASVKAIAEAICRHSDWIDKETGAERFCHAILTKLREADSQAIEFFDALSWLSRSLSYDTKDRDSLDALGFDEVIQGIFEATHPMCSAHGGYDLSLNYFLRDVEKSVYFSKLPSERLETLNDIRALYRSNWKVLRDRIQEEMGAEDYLKLQAWIKDCRQQIEQAIKHQEKSCLRDICGQQQFIFGQANNPSCQHASIALFIDVLNNDLQGVEKKCFVKTEIAPKLDEQSSIVRERQQEEDQKKRVIRQIAQKEQEADEVYEKVIAINALSICDLKTQNEWRFEAWRLFVVNFFWQEEGFEGLGIPLFYLRNADEIIKQELEAFCAGSHSKSPTSWMWQYHSAIETLTLNQWVDDALNRLQRARSIESNLRFAEVARPTLGDRRLPIYGSPPRYCLYAALFEKLLLDPPDCIRRLPESGGQQLSQMETQCAQEPSHLNSIQILRLQELCERLILDEGEINPYRINRQHNQDKFKSFWFMMDWPEFKAISSISQELIDIEFALVKGKALIVPKGETLESVVFRKYRNSRKTDLELQEIIETITPISSDRQENLRKKRAEGGKAFIQRVLRYAKDNGIDTAFFEESLNSHNNLSEFSPEPMVAEHTITINAIPTNIQSRHRVIVEHLMKFPGQFLYYSEKNGEQGIGDTLGLSGKTVRNYVAEIISAWGTGCPIKSQEGSAGYFPEN